MSRIYTKGGDAGTTCIRGGVRLPKTDIRIETNGTIDELNVATGAIRTLLPAGHEWQSWLRDIQLSLMSAMSHVALRSDMRDSGRPAPLAEGSVEGLERLIDRLTVPVEGPVCCMVPCGTPVAAACHQARVTARRAERRLWALHDTDPVDTEVLRYMNRLSDLFFTMARHDMRLNGIADDPWRPS